MDSPESFVPIVHQPCEPPRRFVLVGHHASSTDAFSLDDLPTSGGRMDIVARSIRAAFLLANGIRRGTNMDLVLLGGACAPTTVRIEGAAVRFLRPDERRLAGHLRHVLGVEVGGGREGFEVVAPGMLRARFGLREIMEPWRDPVYVLDSQGQDIRDFDLRQEATFVLGDHTGLTEQEVHWLCERGALRLRVGPVEIHAEDAIAVVHNEIDRQLLV